MCPKRRRPTYFMLERFGPHPPDAIAVATRRTYKVEATHGATRLLRGKDYHHGLNLVELEPCLLTSDPTSRL